MFSKMKFQNNLTHFFISVIYFFLITTSLSSQSLLMVTGDESGNYHKGGLILKKVAEASGINITLRNTDGSFQYIIELGQNQANLGIAQVDVLVGMGKLNKEYKSYANNCLAIASTEIEYIHIVVNNNSNIKSIIDLKDKMVSTGSANSGTAFTAGFILAYTIKGVDVSKPNFISMDEEESLKKVALGELDAAFITITPNSTILNQLPSDSNIRLLSFNKNELPTNLKKQYFSMIIPRGGYPWLTEDVEVPVTASFLLASKSTNEKILAKLVEIFYNNEEILDSESHLWSKDASKSYKELKKIGIPYHPLVDKFLKSKK